MKTETEIYDVDWFIRFYEAIPEDRWTANRLHDGDRSCAMGHLCKLLDKMPKMNDDHIGSINSLFVLYLGSVPPAINDGRIDEFTQPTPKQRILAALHKIKELQTSEAAELQAVEEANKILQEPLKLESVEQF